MLLKSIRRLINLNKYCIATALHTRPKWLKNDARNLLFNVAFFLTLHHCPSVSCTRNDAGLQRIIRAMCVVKVSKKWLLSYYYARSLVMWSTNAQLLESTCQTPITVKKVLLSVFGSCDDVACFPFLIVSFKRFYCMNYSRSICQDFWREFRRI